MPNKPHPTPKGLTSSWPDVPFEDPAGEAARRFVVKLRYKSWLNSVSRRLNQALTKAAFDAGA